MRILNPKKLMVSCLLFLLANATTPSIAHELSSTPITQQVSVSTIDYAQTQLSSPFILNMAQYFPDIAHKAIAYSATTTLQEIRSLYSSIFQFSASLVAPLSERKGGGGYLWLGSHFDHVTQDGVDPHFFTRLDTLLTSSEFLESHLKMNPQLAPKIIEDGATHNALLATAFTQESAIAMLANFYTVFSGYVVLQKKRGKETIISSGAWGQTQGVRSVTSYVLQIVAATLANVTTLSLQASDSLDQAVAFLKQESGTKVSSVITHLVSPG